MILPPNAGTARDSSGAKNGGLDPVARGEPTAHFRNRPTGSLGGDSDVDDESVERVLPQVVGAPPPDLAEKIGLHPGADHGSRLKCVVALMVLAPPPERGLGKVPLANVLVIDGVIPGGPLFLDRISGELEEHFTREGVVPRVKLPKVGHESPEIPAGRHPAESDLDRFPTLVVTRSLSGHGRNATSRDPPR